LKLSTVSVTGTLQNTFSEQCTESKC